MTTSPTSRPASTATSRIWTFDELRKLDFGSWKSPEYAGEQIPTLEEVLEVAQGFQDGPH